MSSRSRQMLLLGVLIAAFVVLLGRQFLPAFGDGSNAAPRRSPVTGPAGTESGPVEIAELWLDAMEHKPAAYQPGRDPFRFGPAEQKPPPPDPAAEQPKRRRRPKRRQPQPAAPATPPPAQPPPIEFVYLGSFGVPGREIAVFSDGQEILNAFAGDVVQQEFVVRSIGYESADIGFVNFPEAPAKRLAVGG